MCPVAVFDTDKGLDGAVTLFRKARKEDVDVWAVEGAADMRDIVTICSTGKLKGKEYKTVVLDSLSEFHSMILEMKIAEAGRAGKAAQIQDYRDATDTIVGFLNMVKRRGMVHFICTAGESPVENQVDGGVFIYPGLSGKLPMRVVHHFGLIGYLTAEVSSGKGVVKVARTLQVQPVQRKYAKDRMSDGRLGIFVADPTMDSLYKTIYNEGAPVFQPQADVETVESSETKEEDN
jgi:hypothetical protein